MLKVLWAHGLEGRANGSKPTYLIEEYGWEVVSPEMAANGWTISDQTNIILEMISDKTLISTLLWGHHMELSLSLMLHLN